MAPNAVSDERNTQIPYWHVSKCKYTSVKTLGVWAAESKVLIMQNPDYIFYLLLHYYINT